MTVEFSFKDKANRTKNVVTKLSYYTCEKCGRKNYFAYGETPPKTIVDCCTWCGNFGERYLQK